MRTRLVATHPANDWALPLAMRDPDLVDQSGHCIVPADAVDIVYPLVGRPYVDIKAVFALDTNGELALTADGIETRPIRKRIKQPRGWSTP